MTSPRPSEDGPQVRESFTVKPRAKGPSIAVRSVVGDESAMTAAPDPAPSLIDRAKDESLATLADSDNRYIRIPVDMLPSKGLFYNYTALSVRKFPYGSLKKLARAQATASFRTIVEVLNEVTDRDVFQMTSGDFWYLMYWHRINSYLSAPLDITFKCGNPAHIACTQLEPTDEMYRAPETLDGVVTLKASNLQVEFIQDEESVAKHIAMMWDRFKVMVHPVRVIDVIDSLEMMDKLSGLEAFKAQIKEGRDDESSAPAIAVTMGEKVMNSAHEEWDNDNASLLAVEVHGTSLMERKKWLDQHTDENDFGYELVQSFEDFTELVAHGVRESVRTTCRGCGSNAEGLISANALRFFPSLL